MCKADISLGTYDWIDNNRRPLTNFHTEHSCYDFAAVDDWARQHSFDMYDNVSLVHPSLGKHDISPQNTYRTVASPTQLTIDFHVGRKVVPSGFKWELRFY